MTDRGAATGGPDKGAAVPVEGRPATREYADKQGKTQEVAEVVVAGARGMVNVLSRKPVKGRPAGDGDDSDDAE